MNSKVRIIIGWVLSGALGLLFIYAAYGKLVQTPESLKIADGMGLNPQSYMILGIVELSAMILFLIPRTGILGTLLLTAYIGGAIATHLEHGQPIMAACGFMAILWIAAVMRFPELTVRIAKR